MANWGKSMRAKGTARESGAGSGRACLKRAGKLMGLALREQGDVPTHPALSQAAESNDEGQRQFPGARPPPSD